MKARLLLSEGEDFIPLTNRHLKTDSVALCPKVPNAEKCIKINIRRAFLSPIIIFQQLKNKYVKCQQKILFKKIPVSSS